MSQNLTFKPKNDIPDLAGKVFFITGGTAGLGKATILELSQHNPEHIYFTGRNSNRASEVISEAKKQSPSVELTFIECDQTSLASVEAAAKEFSTKSKRLDVLICNAGVMAIEAGTTKDGYEIQFGINHLAHALFIKALLPIIQHTTKETEDARIVILTSTAYRVSAPSGGIIFEKLKSTQNIAIAGRWLRYGQSKLANTIYASELAKRFPGITSLSIHPGVIMTELVSTLGFVNRAFVKVSTVGQKVELHEGAYNTEWAATTEKKNIKSGSFYQPVGVLGEPTAYQADPKLGEKLWDWTQKELENYGNA